MASMSVDPVVIGTAGASLEDLERVAVAGATLELDEDVWERVRAGREVVERELVSGRMIYGLTAQLGASRNEPIPQEQMDAYNEMAASFTFGHGRVLDDHEVRALLFARIAGAARGGSGLSVEAVQTLLAMLNAGIHPIVHEGGSVGASDLSQMAEIVRVALGRGKARFDGETLPGAEAIERAGIERYKPKPKEGIAFVSANAVSIGLGALAVLDAERLARIADAAFALSLEALRGNLSPYQDAVARAKPFPGQIEAAAHVRELLAGSYLEDPNLEGVSVQDPLSFRTMPQVHGALREQIAACRRAVEIELNSMDDNPLVAVELDRILSNGNFHPMVLALTFETLRVAFGHVGIVSERRMKHLYANARELLESFFSAGGTTAQPRRPFVIGSFSAAEILAELKQLAGPVTLGIQPLEMDVEDHATLAPSSVALARKAADRLSMIVSVEALSAFTAIDWAGEPPRLGAGTRRVFDLVARVLDEYGSEDFDVYLERTRQALLAEFS
jgi:histidine ammonia-lyase